MKPKIPKEGWYIVFDDRPKEVLYVYEVSPKGKPKSIGYEDTKSGNSWESYGVPVASWKRVSKPKTLKEELHALQKKEAYKCRAPSMEDVRKFTDRLISLLRKHGESIHGL